MISNVKCYYCGAERHPSYGYWQAIYTKSNPNTILCPRCQKKRREGNIQ